MNKKTIVCLICLSFISAAPCGVTFRLADPNTLLPYSSPEIFLGNPVTLVIHSDVNEPWQGGLFIRGEERANGILQGRGSREEIRKYPASCMADAGNYPRTVHWKDSYIRGFDFYTDNVNPSPGDWFMVDYLALESGPCHIEFYTYTDPNSWNQPVSTLLLENTPSRDFTGNGIVNMEDFMRLASLWMITDCTDPNWCGQTDLDRNGFVGLGDLLMFSEYWLWGIPGWKPPQGPSDPNVIYRITDGGGLTEIELPVGESVTLYIQKTTLQKDVFIIQVEAILSDTELGWIDNTEYDPNNPPGPGTARILATPRISFFDDWGPGYTQFEGIQFLAINLGKPIEDGDIASFIYTASAVGDVTLSLVDYGSIPSTLNPIVIHQTDWMDSQSQSGGMDPETTTPETNPITEEETVEFLESVWEENPEMQQTISQEEWDAFIEKLNP